uniref:Uncharacterized protein n=1 Tax=Parastrongyloides trichosuri TaxID=131310 RepID=A0A0N4ZE94_PARTI
MVYSIVINNKPNLKKSRVVNGNSQYQCVACRSPYVEYYLDLFMLPQKNIMNLPPSDKCQNPANTQLTNLVVPCDKYCTTIAIANPDYSINSSVPQYLYVRGCQSTLTFNVEPSVTDSDLDSLNQYCEYDSSFYAFKSDGNPISVEYIASLCLTTITSDEKNIEPCNRFLGTGDAEHAISQLRGSCNALRSKKNYACYQCEEEEQNCKKGNDGSQAYCIKRYMKVGDNKYYVKKGSTNINPYFTQSTCFDDASSYSLSSFIDVQARKGVCFCSDKEYCNGGSFFDNSIKSIIIPVTTFIFFSIILS